MEMSLKEFHYTMSQIPVVDALEGSDFDLVEDCLNRSKILLCMINKKNNFDVYESTLSINIRLLEYKMSQNLQLSFF